jgi:AraC family transcriptional activator of pobA
MFPSNKVKPKSSSAQLNRTTSSEENCVKEYKLSANYFGDLIKKETGKTTLELIHLKILDLAKDKVMDNTKPISEIAYELGFKNPQHFTCLFKQKLGLSPLEFRGLN